MVYCAMRTLQNVIRLVPAARAFSILQVTVWLDKMYLQQPLLYYGPDLGLKPDPGIENRD